MDVTPLIKSGTQVIQSYSGGQFKISGQSFEGGVLVFPEDSQDWNVSGDVSALSLDDFEAVIARASDVDVVLFGSGAQMRFLDPALRNALKEKGVSVDVMDTGAACRTYNVLVAEGRRVAAALLPAIVF